MPNSPVASPAALQFTNVGTNYNQNVTVTETGYAGTFTPLSQNTSVVTVATTATAGVFAVTPVAPGQTTLTFTDSGGRFATVTATVTTTGIVISKKHS